MPCPGRSRRRSRPLSRASAETQRTSHACAMQGDREPWVSRGQRGSSVILPRQAIESRFGGALCSPILCCARLLLPSLRVPPITRSHNTSEASDQTGGQIVGGQMVCERPRLLESVSSLIEPSYSFLLKARSNQVQASQFAFRMKAWPHGEGHRWLLSCCAGLLLLPS